MSFNSTQTCGEIIQLDLGRVVLYGWEEYRFLEIFQAKMNEIRAGASFSPVPIHRFGSDNFVLCDRYKQGNKVDGGHHRAFAHYKSGVPLLCRLLPAEYCGVHYYEKVIPISEIKLV